MRQILDVVVLGPQRGESGRREGRMGLLEHRQDRGRVDGHGQFGDAVLWEELHLLQAGSCGGGGGGAGAGVERVRLGAVCQAVLLQLQVTSQRVNVVNNLARSRGASQPVTCWLTSNK